MEVSDEALQACHEFQARLAARARASLSMRQLIRSTQLLHSGWFWLILIQLHWPFHFIPKAQAVTITKSFGLRSIDSSRCSAPIQALDEPVIWGCKALISSSSSIGLLIFHKSLSISLSFDDDNINAYSSSDWDPSDLLSVAVNCELIVFEHRLAIRRLEKAPAF